MHYWFSLATQDILIFSFSSSSPPQPRVVFSFPPLVSQNNPSIPLLRILKFHPGKTWYQHWLYTSSVLIHFRRTFNVFFNPYKFLFTSPPLQQNSLLDPSRIGNSNFLLDHRYMHHLTPPSNIHLLLGQWERWTRTDAFCTHEKYLITSWKYPIRQIFYKCSTTCR